MNRPFLALFLAAMTFFFAAPSSLAANPEESFAEGRELFDRGMYSEAAKVFAASKGSEAEGYRLLCLVMVNSVGYEDVLLEYEKNYPASGLLPLIYYRHGLNLFSRGAYGLSLIMMEKLNPRLLPWRDRSEACFKKAYCAYRTSDPDGALHSLEVLSRMGQTDYSAAGACLAGLIHYEAGRYGEATKFFEISRKDGRFTEISDHCLQNMKAKSSTKAKKDAEGLDLKLLGGVKRGKTGYIKAGAGYPLHPEVDFVFTPFRDSDFALNLSAGNKSYFGKYGSAVNSLEWTGYESVTRAGIDGAKYFSNSDLLFDASFKGIHSKNGIYGDKITSALGGLNAGVQFSSRSEKGWIYGAGASVNWTGENITSFDRVSSFGLVCDGRLGYKYFDHSVYASLHYTHTSYSGLLGGSLESLEISPHYTVSRGRTRIDLGAKVGLTSRSVHKNQILYPDVSISYELIHGRMDGWASVTGGNTLYEYNSLKDRDPFYTANIPGVGGNSAERFNVSAGIRGNIATAFRYELAAGFRLVADQALYATGEEFLRYIAFAKFREGYLRGMAVFDRRPYLLQANWLIRSSSVEESEGISLFLPRRLKLNLKGAYRWKSRILFGIEAEISSGLRGEIGTCGYTDLGLYAEYAMDRTISLFARAGNLLGRKIILENLMSRKGCYGTLGLVYNF